MIKKQKIGISLIVLVITIIVIIILAGSVILSLADNNPVSTANEAKFKTNVEQYNSELGMVISSKYLLDNTFDPSSLNAGVWDGFESNKAGTIKEYITNITPEDGEKFVIQNGKLAYIGIEAEQIEYVTDIGVINPELTKPLLGINVIATENSTVNGQAPEYNNPIIPKGFKAINDGTKWPTDWNKGLVIEDVNGNQFVWVPVDGNNITYTTDYTDYVYTFPAGITNETDQIDKYEGFYIARYEAGNENSVLVSKKNATVWNNITHTSAKTQSQAMYTTPEVKSGVITEEQFNVTLTWLGNSIINLPYTACGNLKNSESPANVTGFGLLQKTGFSDYWKVNNIYDFIGNTYEFINEKYRFIYNGVDYGTYVCYIGGSYFSDVPIQYRMNTSINDGSKVDISFRVVLYIL